MLEQRACQPVVVDLGPNQFARPDIEFLRAVVSPLAAFGDGRARRQLRESIVDHLQVRIRPACLLRKAGLLPRHVLAVGKCLFRCEDDEATQITVLRAVGTLHDTVGVLQPAKAARSGLQNPLTGHR